ncbi:MAG: hypothetical protein PVI37_01840 [Gammaproteobacteria bacterium]|jgi:hypothetical protein
MHNFAHRPHLAREITLVLIVKLAALALIWWLFFSPPHRVPVNPQTMDRVLLQSRTDRRDSSQPRPSPAPSRPSRTGTPR